MRRQRLLARLATTTVRVLYNDLQFGSETLPGIVRDRAPPYRTLRSLEMNSR